MSKLLPVTLPWTKVSLDNSLLGQLCHWTKVPWTTVATPRPTVVVPFVQATFDLATFVHWKISAVIDQILTKLGNLNFWNQNFFGTDFLIPILFDPNQMLSEPRNAKKNVLFI